MLKFIRPYNSLLQPPKRLDYETPGVGKACDTKRRVEDFKTPDYEKERVQNVWHLV